MEDVRPRAAQLAAARPHRGKRALGHSEHVQQLGIPAAGRDIEQEGARRVGRVGDVLAGELEQQPRVDRAEHGPSLLRPLREPVDVAQQPLDLRRREVGVEHQAGLGPDRRLLAGRPQLVAATGRPAVLPDERTVQRLTGRRIPAHDRLALVGDPDRLQLAGLHAGVVERLAGDCVRDVPDLRRVVLDPARPREVLGELAVRTAEQLSLEIEHQAGRAGRALVDGEQHQTRSL